MTLDRCLSGHGVQYEGDDKNYYSSARRQPRRSETSQPDALSEIYDSFKQCPAEKETFAGRCLPERSHECRQEKSSDGQLESVTGPQLEAVPKGVVALFSCSAGQESYEWPELKHGVFFNHVLEGWNMRRRRRQADHCRRHRVLLAAENGCAAESGKPCNPQLESDFEGTWVLRKIEGPVASESPSLRRTRSNTKKPAVKLARADSLAIDVVGNNNTIVFRNRRSQ